MTEFIAVYEQERAFAPAEPIRPKS